MSGMHGISGSSNMSRNCKMEGMHGNAKSEIKKTQQNEDIKKNSQTKIPDNFRGKAIDIQI